MKISLTVKSLLSLGVVFLLIVASAGLIYFLEWKKIIPLSEDSQKQKLDSEVQKERSNQIIRLKGEIGNIEEKRKYISRSLASNDDIIPLLSTIEGIARESRNEMRVTVADLKKIKPAKKTTAAEKTDESEAADQKSAKTSANATDSATAKKSTQNEFDKMIGFTLEIQGDYKSLYEFVYRLERIPYFVKIYNLKSAPVVNMVGNSSAQTRSGSQSFEVPSGELDKSIKTSILLLVYSNE